MTSSRIWLQISTASCMTRDHNGMAIGAYRIGEVTCSLGRPGRAKQVCHALAGRFISSLYVMSFNEFENERHLKKLSHSPQKGDILLLEDIDSAGIMRENMRGGEKKAPWTSEPRVSLSGLLGAIDGLPDGVVLVMTSNRPESLEQALIRPGRIDKQVLFGNVSQVVAKSIYVRMYQNDSNAPGFEDTFAATRLGELGDAFASQSPNLRLTPAEIQGFLIEYSGAPETAV
ncbi:hypothetical protein P171DRAFT_498336, partial [Karstenula rhodostoma CBS 690.94]